VTTIIDDKGQLFGLVNIIDLIAIQLVAAVGAAGVAYLQPDWSALAIAGIITGDFALLAALAYYDNPTPSEDSAESNETDAQTGPDVVSYEVEVASVELANGDAFEIVLRSNNPVRTDGGDQQ